MSARAFRSSLRARLLVMVFLAVVPAFWLLLYGAAQQRSASARAVEQSTRTLVRMVASDHEENFQQTHRLLEGLANLPAIQSRSASGCRDIFAALLKADRRYLSLNVLDTDGAVLCSLQDYPEGLTPSAGVMEAVRGATAQGDFAVSRFTIGQISKRPIIAFAHVLPPVAGRPAAVVHASMSVDWLNRFATDVQLPASASLTILDRDGTILVRHPDPEVWVGRRAQMTPHRRAVLQVTRDTTYVSQGMDDVERLVAATPLRSPDGSVHGFALVGIPTEHVFAGQRRLLRDSLFLLALLTLVAGSAAWFGGDLFVLRRVNALLEATGRLKAGDRTARTGVRSGDGELEQLARAFDEMADALQRRQEEAEATAVAVRQSEESYRSLFDSVADGMFIMDLEGRFIAVNRKVTEELGYTTEELIGQTPALTGDPATTDPATTAAAFARALAGEMVLIEGGGVRKDGSVFPTEVVMSRGTYFGKDVVIAVARDVSARKQAEEALRQSEEQLRQAQKMEAVGRLAGGIAHDFNNLLTAIRGNVEMARLELAASSPIQEELEQVQKAADTAASLTRQLLAFSRRQTLELQAIDLSRVAENTVRLLRRLIGPDVELVTEPGESLWSIRADSSQIEQVIMNLAVNARDAMPEGGRLTLRTANVELAEGDPSRPSYVAPGSYVRLSVSDTGYGMDSRTQQRIFEPFFTTKEQGKGTGLGLFTVYGIASQCGGHVWAESTVGAGTTFHLLFPAVRESAATSPLGEPGAALAGGAETVLLVEDEAGVRLLAQRLLRRIGYNVIEASNGEEALQAAQRHTGPIHLMLTDMTMPRMGGRELAQHMASRRPEMKVIYMSGYTEEVLPIGVVSGSHGSFIHKPFTLNILASTIRSALDRNG